MSVGEIRVLRLASELRCLRREWGKSQPVALVPTMGDLHAGHLSLVQYAARFGPVVVSIFVNPTQFGPGEDFAAYRRNLEGDVATLAALGLPLVVFAPAPGEIYDVDASTWVEVAGVSEPLCGLHRPGHFRGVATVVTKLFALTQPDLAVFGEKDAQQCLVLRKMVLDLRLPVELMFVPTLRESDGLAMSSRNRYLDATQRVLAGRLWQALLAAEHAVSSGERRAEQIGQVMRAQCAGIELDYAEPRRLPGLEAVDHCEGPVLLAIAGRIGPARLIDNLALYVDVDSVRRTPLLAAHTESAVRERLQRARHRIEGGVMP